MKMSKGLIVSCQHLQTVTTVVKLFNGQEWEIREGGQAYRFTTLFEKGKKSKRLYFQPAETSNIFPQIKIVYDKKGREIASRLNSKGRLITTAFNKLWTTQEKDQLKKKQQKINQALQCYSLVQAIEEQEYRESIQTYLQKNKRIC